ncbi:putative secreted Zn-dependent protease [Rhizobium aquaticum]|uniref:Secreted Zn-dependent protease n=1 Tax=Rhizobium aquaticum TaxID=1549636 RepID=A0ABV2J5I9_9HYPH
MSRTVLALAFALAMSPVATSPLAAQEPSGWKPTEKIERYAISGQSELDLYKSIGDKGPMVRGGKVRAIAYTDFKLTWDRAYESDATGACRLARNIPNVTIIYRFPKPSGKLAPSVKANWNTFEAGIEAHERQHGQFIMQMVRRMVAETSNLSAANDPTCKKVRAELTRRMGAAFKEKSGKDAAFDKTEMGDGGNVRQLVMTFVYGG